MLTETDERDKEGKLERSIGLIEDEVEKFFIRSGNYRYRPKSPDDFVVVMISKFT